MSEYVLQMRDGMCRFPGTRGNSSNPCESGSMVLSFSTYRLRVVQYVNFQPCLLCLFSIEHTQSAIKVHNKFKASFMDLAMKEKISKPKSDMVPTEKEKIDCTPLRRELRCSTLKIQELNEELKYSTDLSVISWCGVSFRFEETVIDTCVGWDLNKIH